MTEEFKKQLEEAQKEAATRYEEKLETKYKKQEKYAKLYLKLVASIIKAFDYDEMEVDLDKISLGEYVDIIGNPHINFKNVDDNNISVCFSYIDRRDGWGEKSVAPNDSNIDYDILNKILDEDRVFIKKSYIRDDDGWQTDKYELCLSFDSSILEVKKTKSESKEKVYQALKNKRNKDKTI